MILDFLGIGEWISEFFHDVLITLLAGLYVVVSDFYQIFLVLARTNIFEQSTYQSLTEKVYIILAVVMLFVLAYNFITLIIDPDKNKGGKVVEDIIKNAVTSLILIVLCPTLFTIAFDLQDAVLNQGIISKFFTVDGSYDASGSIQTGGRLMAGTTFAAFFTPNAGVDAADVKNESEAKVYTGTHYEVDANGKEITKKDSLDCSSKGKCTLEQAIDFATVTGDFMVFHAFSKNLTSYSDATNRLDLSFLLSLVAGGFLIFTIASFCFDLALRVIKLAFYQIISPICIAFRVVPGKDGIFKSWWKAVSKTYLSVFVRIFIMNLAVFLLITLKEASFWEVACPNCSFRVNLLAYAFLVMGLLMFIKQSTKLIDEIFGFGEVNMGFGAFKDSINGARDTLRGTGVYGAGAAVGAGVKGMKHGITSGVKAFKATKGQKGWRRALSAADIGGKALRRSASASLRSISASTGGFGFGGFKEDFDSMKANKNAAVQGADLGSLAWKDRGATVKQWADEAKDLKMLRQKIKNQIAAKRQLEEDLLYQAALKAKITLDTLDATLSASKKSLELAQEREQAARDRLNSLGADASEKERKDANKELTDATRALADWQQKVADDTTKRAAAETTYRDLCRDFAHANGGETVEQRTTKITQMEEKISTSIEQTAEFRWTQTKENIGTRIAEEWTGVDQARAQELVMQYNDKIKDATTKIINKHSSKITVDLASSLKKNSAFTEDMVREISSAFSSSTVADINSVASKLSAAQTFEQAEKILPASVVTALGLNPENWTKYTEAFVNVVREPYSKEVNKAVADAVVSGDPEFEYGGHKVFTGDDEAGIVLSDLDAKDVSRKKYAYDVLHFELYGTAAPKTSAGRKALEDELRKKNAANDRAKAGKQVMSDVRSVNASANSGSKK